MKRWSRLGWWFGVALLLGLLGSPRLHAAGSISASAPPLPWAAFWLKVSATQTTLNELQPLAAPARQPQLQALADDWATVTAIGLPSGEVVPVDLSAWVAALREPEADPEQLAATLAAWVAARDHRPVGPHTAQDLQTLTEILQRPEFRALAVAPPSPLEKWWRDLQRQFWQWLEDWLPEGAGLTIDQLWVNVLAVITVTLLGLLLAAILRGALGQVSAEATWQDPHATDIPLTADAARQRAHTLAEGGDHRTAVRYLYLSALLALEERGLLRYDRSLTNREYVRQVRQTPALAAGLQNVVEVFDRVWYGYQEVDADVYARYAQQVQELRQTRGEGPSRGDGPSRGEGP